MVLVSSLPFQVFGMLNAFPSDEFYVFEKSAPTPIPLRIPLKELPEVDILQDIIRPSDVKKDPVVELSSEKSGLKLAFSTNREWPCLAKVN
jgi:hypothetical protein